MNLWHQFLSSYFGFNKQQRNGLFVLVILILTLFVLRLSLSHFIKPEPLLIADFSNIQFPESNSSFTYNDTSKTKRNNPSSGTLFVFNPNTVTKEQLLKLGFKDKTANIFLNYRNKGGHFNKKEDVKKVYGISESFYTKLEPFILLENDAKKIPSQNSTGPVASVAPTTAVRSKTKLELNSADSLQLLELRGIGPAFTKRILKYRSLLGGFVSVNQLSEVYGMEDELFQSLKNEVSINPSLARKIDLNNENFKELNKHPYLSYEDMKAIFNYRRKNGPINSLEQVKEIISDETAYNKLLPYLDIKQ